MDTSQIPTDVATSIKRCWPNGVVEEFSTDQSYLHEIRPRLERDLRNIRGASLLWQTEEEEISATGPTRAPNGMTVTLTPPGCECTPEQQA